MVINASVGSAPPDLAEPPGRPSGSSWYRMAGRALDPRLTIRLRTEREVYQTLSGPLRPGGSVVVIGNEPVVQAAVAGLISLAVARFQRSRVLAVDASMDGGLAERLAARGAPGRADDVGQPGAVGLPTVLARLGVRDPGRVDRPLVKTWLYRELVNPDGVLLAGADPAGLTGPEHLALVAALTRYVTLFVTHAPQSAAADLVPWAVHTADRVVVVGADNRAGHQDLRSWLGWLGQVRRQPQGQAVVAALLPLPTGGRTSGMPVDLGVAHLVLPRDDVLVRRGPLGWGALAPGTQDIALQLASRCVERLGDDPESRRG